MMEVAGPIGADGSGWQATQGVAGTSSGVAAPTMRSTGS
jgi:hypothetical protein